MARVSEDLCLGEVEVGARSSHNTHLPPFHAQGSRQGCQGGGSGRVLILGGSCPAMLRAAQTALSPEHSKSALFGGQEKRESQQRLPAGAGLGTGSVATLSQGLGRKHIVPILTCCILIPTVTVSLGNRRK